MSTQITEQDEYFEPQEASVEPVVAAETGQEPVEAPEDAQEPQEVPEVPEDQEAVDEDQETFPRAYVEKLRRQSAGHRERAKRADEYAAALWEARVTATGRLADATDLPLPAEVDPMDPEAVEAAVEDLLARKPHLATRRPSGSIGQGVGSSGDTVGLAGILRANV